jgi:K+-transporting ATPase KdpF subunit
MNLIEVVTLVVTVFAFIFLVWALLRAEEF